MFFLIKSVCYWRRIVMKGGPLAARWLLGNRLLYWTQGLGIPGGARTPDPAPSRPRRLDQALGRGPTPPPAGTCHPGLLLNKHQSPHSRGKGLWTQRRVG